MPLLCPLHDVNLTDPDGQGPATIASDACGVAGQERPARSLLPGLSHRNGAATTAKLGAWPVRVKRRRCGSRYLAGAPRMVPTLPSRVVSGASTAAPRGRLFGGCGSVFPGAPALERAVETGAFWDSSAHPTMHKRPARIKAPARISVLQKSRRTVESYNIRCRKDAGAVRPGSVAGPAHPFGCRSASGAPPSSTATTSMLRRSWMRAASNSSRGRAAKVGAMRPRILNCCPASQAGPTASRPLHPARRSGRNVGG